MQAREFDVLLTTETRVAGGNATLLSNKRADICVVVKGKGVDDWSSVTRPQATAIGKAGTSGVKKPPGRAPSAPSAGCSVIFDDALGVYKTDEATKQYWTGDPPPPPHLLFSLFPLAS